jgi:hypothetical protein
MYGIAIISRGRAGPEQHIAALAVTVIFIKAGVRRRAIE